MIVNSGMHIILHIWERIKKGTEESSCRMSQDPKLIEAKGYSNLSNRDFWNISNGIS